MLLLKLMNKYATTGIKLFLTVTTSNITSLILIHHYDQSIFHLFA